MPVAAQMAATEAWPAILNPAWRDGIPELRFRFGAQEPFPFVVIDDFFTPEIAAALSGAFPPVKGMPKVFRELWAYKGQLSDIRKHCQSVWPIVETLHGPAMTGVLNDITGVADLEGDPILAAAGMHQYPRRGFQEIHIDPNRHPMRKELHRRVNLLVYLSQDWESGWGGEFEAWSDAGGKPGTCVASIAPKYNRALIFYSSGKSWHAVARVNCPETQSRKALAIYYYTHGRPADELYEDSSAIWHSRDPWKRAVFPVANAAIRLLKPYARYLRPLRGKVFDAAERDPYE